MSGMHGVRYRIVRERLTQDAASAADDEHDEFLRLALLCLALLHRHEIDVKGRCRRCRTPGRWWPWSRRCTVLPMLSLYLDQPREFLTRPDS
jgi:hypothetical protein